MANLYITSAETFSGKSALCVGVGLRLRQDGLKIGYMKPVNINCELCDGLPNDDDVTFARSTFELSDAMDVLSPVALTPARLDSLLRGNEMDFEARIKDAYQKAQVGRDLLILEGGRNLGEGYVAKLPPRKVVELTHSRALVVLRHDDTLLIDHTLQAQEYFGDALLGAVINTVPVSNLDRIHDVVVPFLMRHGVQVLGVLPKDQLLVAPTVAELAEGLGAEILCCPEHKLDLVEHFLVGAMSVESALSYFRRQTNKVVVTGGDRADIQLAALETSTRCLILTGNLYPSPAVLNRAEELGVPVLLADLDTLATTEVVEGFFGRSRFQQPQKIDRFMNLLEENFNFDALKEGLDLRTAID
jgi:uncharacterized protein